MDGGHYNTTMEFLTLQVYLGSPVFLASVILIALYVRKKIRAGLLATAVSALAVLVLGVAGAMQTWLVWPGQVGIMTLEFINPPALVACLVVVPLVGLFTARILKSKTLG